MEFREWLKLLPLKVTITIALVLPPLLLSDDDDDDAGQEWRRSDINRDGQVNLGDMALIANDWLEPNRVWLIERLQVLEAERAIMQEKVKDFDWFLYWGDRQWGIEPNELGRLYEPNFVPYNYWWR